MALETYLVKLVLEKFPLAIIFLNVADTGNDLFISEN